MTDSTEMPPVPCPDCLAPTKYFNDAFVCGECGQSFTTPFGLDLSMAQELWTAWTAHRPAGDNEQTPALPDQFAVIADHLVVNVGRCTCDGPFETYGHRPECGYEPVMTLAELAVVLSRAGRTVLELPEPSRFGAITATWLVAAHDDDIPPTAVDGTLWEEYGPIVTIRQARTLVVQFRPREARQVVAALAAAVEHVDRLASESSGDGVE